MFDIPYSIYLRIIIIIIIKLFLIYIYCIILLGDGLKPIVPWGDEYPEFPVTLIMTRDSMGFDPQPFKLDLDTIWQSDTAWPVKVDDVSIQKNVGFPWQAVFDIARNVPIIPLPINVLNVIDDLPIWGWVKTLVPSEPQNSW